MNKRQFKKLLNNTRKVKIGIKVGDTITSQGNIFGDRSYRGDELIVRAIDYPFIKIEHAHGALEGTISVYSLIEWDFKVLNKSFVSIKG